MKEPWGLIEMWIADPDGTRIVLVEVPADHPLRYRPLVRLPGRAAAAAQTPARASGARRTAAPVLPVRPRVPRALACPRAAGHRLLRRRRRGRCAVHGPATSGWLLVALCAATGAYCLVRMRSCVGEAAQRGGRRGADGVRDGRDGRARRRADAAAWAWLVYAAVFGAAALRALWPARRGRHHLHHLVGAPRDGLHGGGDGVRRRARTGMRRPGSPLLTGACCVYFTGYVLRTGRPPGAGRRRRTAGGAATGAVGWGDRPELALACRLVHGDRRCWRCCSRCEAARPGLYETVVVRHFARGSPYPLVPRRS